MNFKEDFSEVSQGISGKEEEIVCQRGETAGEESINR